MGNLKNIPEPDLDYGKIVYFRVIYTSWLTVIATFDAILNASK
jgi:hypothetical protein